MTALAPTAIYQIGTDTVTLISPDLAHVSSKSHPGMSYSVTTGGRCTCLSNYHRNRCRHVDVMREARRQQAMAERPEFACCLCGAAAVVLIGGIEFCGKCSPLPGTRMHTDAMNGIAPLAKGFVR